jgi:small subunit ribosomal protein S15
MYTRRRGQSGSDKPSSSEPPAWSYVDSAAIEARICELAEDGYDPSQIGLKLRDEGVNGTPVPDVKLATGQKVTEILEEHGAAAVLPEDLRNLMEEAVRLRDHMDEHPQDHQNKRALQNTESKVRRLVDYYRGDELPEHFSYTYETAQEILEDPSRLDTRSDEESSTSGDPSVTQPLTDTDEDSVEPLTRVIQNMRSLPVTDADGQLVRGPVQVGDREITYERFTTGESAIYWPATLGVTTFLSRLRGLDAVTPETPCELILLPGDHPPHEPLELSLNAVSEQPDLENRCEFVAAITEGYEVTWESRPSQPGAHDAEITILFKQDRVNISDIFPQLFADAAHKQDRQQSATSLIAKLHRTDRDQLLAQI